MPELVFGSFPHPGFQDRLITNKPEGVGWNNLGVRRPYSITLHRIIGNLWGTDAYFRDPSVPALTDYGIGVEAEDGKQNAGTILRWCDPTGYVTPWASGPVSSPYGDGLCLLTYFGYYDAANKNAVSIEISGYQDTPIDNFSFGELAKLCAYWADQIGVPYDGLTDFFLTGCSGFVHHQEYTIGTGKECPFAVVMGRTDELITCVHDLLLPYQTGGEAQPAPIPPDEEENILADFPKSDLVLNSEPIWPKYGGGKVSKAWAEYGARTGVFNPPGQPWNDEQEGGTVYCFDGGPCFDGEGKLIVKVE